LSFYFGATEATMLELLYNIAEWLYEHGKQELFTMPELPQFPLEKLLPEIQYAF
jgi:TfoX/Sxy family transcriptional regulator of competence genes